MDFIIGLPMTWRQHDSIMVVVDKLTKASHFIPIKSTYKVDSITKLFMKDIFILHGFPKAIISDRDTKFTSNFWKGLFAGLGTKSNFSTAYHPQTDGQTESKSGASRHASHICNGQTIQVGGLFTLGRVCI